MGGLNEFLTTPPTGERLTPEVLDAAMAGLLSTDTDRPITDEEWEIVKERGAAIIGNRIVFANKARIVTALETNDFSALTPYEIIAINIASRQGERETP